MSTEPPERQITNPQEAIREVRISLAGFVGEVLISGKYSIYRNHPDLTGAIELIEEMLAVDEKFKNLIADRAVSHPGTFMEIESPLIRSYIDGKLGWCLRRPK